MNKSEKTKITKQKILEAALREFGTYGYHGATINGICGHNGIAKGLIYHNFEGKDDLYLCCAHYAVSEFIRYVGQWKANADLLQYMRLRNEFLISHPHMGAIIFEMMLNTPQELMEPLIAIKADFDRFNIDLYSRAIHTIRLREALQSKTRCGITICCKICLTAISANRSYLERHSLWPQPAMRRTWRQF